MTDDILTFARPPVKETVLSVGFDPVPGFTAAHLGKFWSLLGDSYTTAEELPYYNMPVEVLDGGSRQTISLELGGPQSQPRVLLYNDDRTRVCQVQRDWFAVNWQQRPDEVGFEQGYRRYGESRQEFAARAQQFVEFVESELHQNIEVRQCEITYLNHISDREGFLNLAKPHEILRVLQDPELSGLANLESLTLSTRQSLWHDGVMVGRLHTSAKPAQTPNGPLMVLDLTARGRPIGPGLDGILDFLDLGREAIVLNFKAITTDSMHEEWGLQQ